MSTSPTQNSPSKQTPSLSQVKDKQRVMKSTMKQVDQKNRNEIKKQMIQIEKLKKDNRILKETIEALVREINVSQTVSDGKIIEKLNEESEALSSVIQQEEREIATLEEKLGVVEEKVMEAKGSLGGIDVVQKNNINTEKQIKVLENRLDKALVKFNEALARNQELRATIDNLRQERKVFDSIYKKMENELHEKKKKMAEIIEQSNNAYEERDEIQNKLTQLKLLHQKTLAAYNKQFVELDEIIKKDEEINERLKKKDKNRKEQQDMDTQKIKKGEDTETKMKKMIGQTAWETTGTKAKTQINTNKLKQIQEMFQKIESATGMSIDDLINKFTDQENQNFSLFTYVNELNTEIENLEVQITDLEKEISLFKGASEDENKKKIIEELQEQVNKMEEAAEKYEQKYAQTNEILKSLCGVVQQIFESIGCDANIVMENLGTSQVTESNIMVFLGMIEQKTNEMLQLYMVKAAKEGKISGETFIKMGPVFAFEQKKISINPPSTADIDEKEEDKEEQPITREKLMKMMNNSTEKNP